MLIQVVARNGGHLSSNLGVVDLTLALHRVFDAPRDKIIWDIGHQCYTHKIITGRRGRIFSIRKKRRPAGISRTARKASTTCSTPATPRPRWGSPRAWPLPVTASGEKFHIVAVIGDGALTGGVALEALNHIGQVKQRLIIILNDNKMSISPNVGGISRHLNYLVSGRPYIRMKEVIQNILKSIPAVGKSLYELAKKIEVLMRTMMVPGSLFDELGIKYIGPVNGHDFAEMLKEFEDGQEIRFPGAAARGDSQGPGLRAGGRRSQLPIIRRRPSTSRTASSSTRTSRSPTRRCSAARVLRLVENDRALVALTAAMPEGTGLDPVQKEFPENFFDVGIAEQYMFDFAGGLALGGLKPVHGRLFHLHAAGRGPDHPRYFTDAHPAGGRPGQGRSGRRRRPDAPGALRHRPAACRFPHRC